MEKYGKSSKKEKEVVNDEGSIRMEKEDDEDEDEDDDDDSSGVGRTYECNYCKRGFTNAQALGGHMNIHRKDKAKAQTSSRLQPAFSSSSSSSFIPQTQTQTQTMMRNYQYYPFPNNSTRFESQPSLIYEGIGNRRTRLFDHHLGGADLSLRISSSSNINNMAADHHHQQKTNNINKQNHHYDDIDLELRLGYHP